MDTDTQQTDAREPAGGRGPLNRRQALTRLGLGAAVVYSAPTILHLDRAAAKKGVSVSCSKGKGKGKGKSWCK